MRKLFIRNIPDDIHRDFKMMCVGKDVSMNTELLRIITEIVKKYRKGEDHLNTEQVT